MPWTSSLSALSFWQILGANFFFSNLLNSSESKTGLRIPATKAREERDSTVGYCLPARRALTPSWGHISFLKTARPLRWRPLFSFPFFWSLFNSLLVFDGDWSLLEVVDEDESEVVDDPVEEYRLFFFLFCFFFFFCSFKRCLRRAEICYGSKEVPPAVLDLEAAAIGSFERILFTLERRSRSKSPPAESSDETLEDLLLLDFFFPFDEFFIFVCLFIS